MFPGIRVLAPLILVVACLHLTQRVDALAAATPSDCFDPSAYPVMLGMVPLRQPTAAIARPPFVLVTTYYDGLFVIDVSDGSRPNIAWKDASSRGLLDIELNGNLAYLATRGEGIATVDISHVESPVYRDFVPIPDPVYSDEVFLDLAIQGSFLYAVSRYALRVFEIAEPGTLRHMTTRQIEGNGYQLTVSGENAYVGVWGGDLYIFDIATPTSPILLRYLDTPTTPRDIEVVGKTGYVADRGEGLRIYDLEDPNNPRLLGTHPIDDVVLRISVWGSLVFLGDGYAGLKIIDVSDPTTPELVGTVGGSIQGYGAMAFAGSRAYVPCGNNGLQIIDFSQLGFQPRTSFTAMPGARTVRFHNGYVLMGGVPALRAFDVADPENVEYGGLVQMGDAVWTMDVQGDYAYLAASYAGLGVVDVSDPGTLELLDVMRTRGSSGFPNSAKDVAVRDGYAFLATQHYGGDLWIVDVSDPDNLQLVTVLPMPSASAIDLWKDWGFLLVNDQGRRYLNVVNIVDPGATYSVASLPLDSSANDLDVSAGHAFVVSLDGVDSRMDVIDVRDPENPIVVAHSMLADDPRSIRVEGSRAYVSTAYGGVQMIDVSTPSRPRWEGFIEAFDVWETEVSGNHVYAATRGLLITPLPCTKPKVAWGGSQPEASSLLRVGPALDVHPNPASLSTRVGFAVEYSQEFAITVFDMRGRRIRDLSHGSFSPGRHWFEWDGNDEDGRPLASGVYVLELLGETNRSTTKITLAR